MVSIWRFIKSWRWFYLAWWRAFYEYEYEYEIFIALISQRNIRVQLRKYINKDIWIPTHYKQTKTLSENTKQWYKIIEYNVERKWQWNDLYTLWYIPQAIAAIIHPVDTEPDEGATAVKRYNRLLWAYRPQLRHRRALCAIRVETRMEKQAMSEQHMKHTEWNYKIWFYVQKHIAHRTVCYKFPLVREKPLADLEQNTQFHTIHTESQKFEFNSYRIGSGIPSLLVTRLLASPRHQQRRCYWQSRIHASLPTSHDGCKLNYISPNMSDNNYLLSDIFGEM